MICRNHTAPEFPTDDISALVKAIEVAREELLSVSDEPILIDITSGKATCSAAAAALTVHRDECFQYISTKLSTEVSTKERPKLFEVILFNLRVERPSLPNPTE